MELVLDFFLMPWAKPFFQLLDHSKFSYEMHWKNHGFSQDEPPKVMCNKILVLEEHAGKVKIEAAFVVQKDQSITKLEQMTNYEVFRDGRIRVSNRVRPMDSVRNIQTLPRIGLSFQLSPAFYKIQYFGRGPHENYPDRKSGSQLGLWKTTGAEMGFDYIVPSENGSRSDCRWASFDSGDGGIVVVADSGTNFCFSALLHSADELHQAFHTSDLDVRKNSIHPIYLNIDHKLLGVGGDVR